MAESISSPHDAGRVVKKRMPSEADPPARGDSAVKKLQELDRLLAQFDNYFPRFTWAVIQLTQDKP